MRECNKKIDELLLDYEKLTIPTSAFITFESDDHKLAALEASKVGNFEGLICNQEFKVDDASEPTDIIWENRHFTTTQYIKRQLCAFSVIAVLLCISFAVIFAISKYSSAVANVFPAVECSGILESYSGDNLQKYAVDDYDYITANADKEVQSSGTLKCFCK